MHSPHTKKPSLKRLIYRSLLLTFAVACLAWATPAQTPVDQAAAVSQAALTKACAGAVGELEAARTLIDKLKAELELQKKETELQAQRGEAATNAYLLSQQQVELLKGAGQDKDRAYAKLEQANEVLKAEASRQEKRVESANNRGKWGTIGGILLTVVIGIIKG